MTFNVVLLFLFFLFLLFFWGFFSTKEGGGGVRGPGRSGISCSVYSVSGRLKSFLLR